MEGRALVSTYVQALASCSVAPLGAALMSAASVAALHGTDTVLDTDADAACAASGPAPATASPAAAAVIAVLGNLTLMYLPPNLI
jgi:hypothetical protein